MIFGVTLGKAYAFSAIVLVSCSRIVIIGGRYTPPHDTVVLPGSSARRTKTSLQCFNQVGHSPLVFRIRTHMSLVRLF